MGHGGNHDGGRNRNVRHDVTTKQSVFAKSIFEKEWSDGLLLEDFFDWFLGLFVVQPLTGFVAGVPVLRVFRIESSFNCPLEPRESLSPLSFGFRSRMIAGVSLSLFIKALSGSGRCPSSQLKWQPPVHTENGIRRLNAYT